MHRNTAMQWLENQAEGLCRQARTGGRREATGGAQHSRPALPPPRANPHLAAEGARFDSYRGRGRGDTCATGGTSTKRN